MSNVFTRISRDQLSAAVAGLLCPRIEETLANRGPGHCMRVNDLHDGVLTALCSELRQIRPDGNIYILGGHGEESQPYRVSSTKLVELRNPDAHGALRQPLLVFIPASLRTSAEDSFGVATFEELTFDNIYIDLTASLLARLPQNLADGANELFAFLKSEEWSFADDISKVRYLLSALENGADAQALGASLFELALIPDFKLFDEPEAINNKVERNLASVRALTSSHKSALGRVADLKLRDKELVARLSSYFGHYDIQELEIWTPPIATNADWRDISFDNWSFRDELHLDTIMMTSLEVVLPSVEQDDFGGQGSSDSGQLYFDPVESNEMTVKFSVDPHPDKVGGLDHFLVEIVSNSDGQVKKSKTVKAWTANRLKCSTKFTKLNKVEFEKGWHFVRVIPQTAEGDSIPLKTDSEFVTAKQSTESKPFIVYPGTGIIDEEPPSRAKLTEQSLEHARFQLQLDALKAERNPDDIDVVGVSLQEGGGSKKANRRETFLANFGNDVTAQIHVSSLLKTVEQGILAKPKHLTSWQMTIKQDIASPPTEVLLHLPTSSARDSFLAAREDFFAAIGKDTPGLIMQAMSFRDAQAECHAYADAFFDLVDGLSMLAEAAVGGERQQAITALRNVLSIDSIYVTSTDFRNRPRVAVLIPPTHPLRALWLCGWSALAEDWIEKIRAGGKEYIPLARSALLEGFMPSAYPVGIPVKGGRIFTPVDNLNAFWALYAPTAEKNSRSLLAEICSALGLPEPSAAGTDVSGKVIADKIERYISQHPYVRELSLNIFKPGAGSVIAEALQILQKKKEYAGLRYDIRLFTPDPDSPVLGEALEAMVRPEAMVGGSADAFATSRGNHLYSKLNLAKHTLEDFHNDAHKFPAHISILLDAFPAGELAIAKKESGATPLHGLIQDFNTEFVDEESGFFWNRWPVVGHSISTTNKTPCFDLLSSLSKQLCFATSAVATAGTSFEATPVVTLGLDAKQRQLIFEVHQFSDWVFTIDRNMGIEYFDHGGHKDKPSYLIDFVPGASAQATHNLIISSRSTDELEAMLKPLMRAHGLTASGTQPAEILDNLRSLSGQLALKLISVSAQQSDALGLGLARMFLKLQGALSNQIIVPLDAHTDLYDAGGKSNEVNDAVSLQRTDLALFDLNLEARTITCSLVGVKCSPQGKPHDVLLQAKKSIMEQVKQSESTLKSHFDPNQKTPDRPDRLLKSRELARILRFYLERSVRYDIFAEAAAAEAHNLIKSIEQGYKLKFKQSALIFDFDHDGTELSDNEEGMQYHRIGKDIIHAMLDNCGKDVATSASASASAEGDAESAQSGAESAQGNAESTTAQGDAESASAQGDAESARGDAESARGDGESASAQGDATSTSAQGNAESASAQGGAESAQGDTESAQGDAESTTAQGDTTSASAQGDAESATRHAGIDKLDSAAFIAPMRVRTTSWAMPEFVPAEPEEELEDIDDFDDFDDLDDSEQPEGLSDDSERLEPHSVHSAQPEGEKKRPYLYEYKKTARKSNPTAVAPTPPSGPNDPQWDAKLAATSDAAAAATAAIKTNAGKPQWDAQPAATSDAAAATAAFKTGAGDSGESGASDRPASELATQDVGDSGEPGVSGPPTSGAATQGVAGTVRPIADSEGKSPAQGGDVRPIPASVPQDKVDHDVVLGVNDDSPQFGLLGTVDGKKVALDLNQTHTISLFGVQGGGKSYTLGTVIEMATAPLQRINVLPSPLATVIFHYSPTQDYAPEFTSMINANTVAGEIAILRERYKANPEALKDVLILTPRNKVDERKAEYPDIEVMPIAFSPTELKAAHWKFLMGAIGSKSMYIRQINIIMKSLRRNLTLESLRTSIENSGISDHLKALAQTRLNFASEYVNESQRLQDLVRPGRLIIVDLRDEYIEKDEALGLFVVMLQILSEATYQGKAFNKLVVFDEAHKYINNADLIAGLVEVVREMRHKGTSIMVASQDPPSVPLALIELSTQIIMHKFNSPGWLKHIQRANAALRNLSSNEMSQLGTGEAYVWASKSSDETFTRGAVRIQCRPRITQHGGSTKTAVGE